MSFSLRNIRDLALWTCGSWLVPLLAFPFNSWKPFLCAVRLGNWLLPFCRTMEEESFIHLEADFCHSKVFAFLNFSLSRRSKVWMTKACLANVTWGMECFGIMILFSWTLETCDVLGRRASYHWASWNSCLYPGEERAFASLTSFERNKNTFCTQSVLCCMNIFVPFKSIVF